MHIHSPAYIQNHVSFALAQQNPQTKLMYTKKNLNIIRILADIGCVHRFFITQSNKLNPNSLVIWLTVFLYKNTPFFKSFRLLSTPSRQYTITAQALRILNTSLGSSTIILSTSDGLITHQSAIYKGIGGLLLFILS